MKLQLPQVVTVSKSKTWIALIVLLLILLVSEIIASRVQRDFGRLMSAM